MELSLEISGDQIAGARDYQEDAFLTTYLDDESGDSKSSALIVVADGMGGHAAGEVASRIAIEEAAETTGNPERRVKTGNEAIIDAVLERPSLAGMGTTLTLAQLDPIGRVTIGHVGDSRAYLLRDGELSQLTVDHSFVQEEVEAGRMTEAEARSHPKRGLITRALGLGRDVEVDVKRSRLLVDDRLLICSDGLNSMIEDEHIAEILAKGSPSEAAWALIEAANQAGGQDNVSVVVVHVEP